MSRPRRFYPGWEGIASGIQFRVVEGKKPCAVPGERDLRLDWWMNSGWEPVTLDAVFLIVDMVCENEDFLYPFPQRGGEEVISYMRLARLRGWQAAQEKLHRARGDKQRRLDEGDAA